MIDYETFCRTIEAWKAGNPAPGPAQPPPPSGGEDNTIIYQMPELLDEDELD